MFKTLVYNGESSKFQVSLFKDKGVYSFACMEIYRHARNELVTDSSEYVTETIPDLLDGYIFKDKKAVFKELEIELDELSIEGAIELKQIIKKVKRKLCKSKVK